jgi:phosphoserine phosphatase
MTNTTILLTRHGETHWNTVRRIQGHLDSPLTEFGELQAKWLGERLVNEPIDVVYTSPLLRAHSTAKIIVGTRDIPIIPCDELKEISLGSWEGLLLEEVNQINPEQNHNFWNEPEKYVPIDGESFEALRERSSHFFAKYIQSSPYKLILVVTHAIALKSFINFTQGKGIEALWQGAHIQPTSLTQAGFDGEKLSYEFIGDISHHRSKSSFNGWFEEK